MSNKSRTSLFVFILLAIVLVYFFYSISKIDSEITAVDNLISIAERELDLYGDFRPDTLRVSYLLEQINYLESWLFHNGKFFLSEDNSMITWHYLQNIINRFNQDFQFNFTTVSGGSNQYNYTVSGSSSMNDLYAFISHIERLGALYTIENLNFNQNFRETDTGPSNIVNYVIVIRPWIDASLGRSLHEQPFRRVQYTPLFRDPMRPAIHPPMRNPNQEQYVAHENLQLVSFTNEQAFFILDKTILTLKPMERVAYGYFSHVDEENNRVVFRINKTGLYETVYKEF